MCLINAAVVFEDCNRRDSIFRFLRPGYRHCYIIFREQERWLIVNPVDSNIKFGFVDDLADYVASDSVIVRVKVQIDSKQRRNGLCWFNCVEVVKAYLGIKSFWTFTPYQLYKLLIRG